MKNLLWQSPINAIFLVGEVVDVGYTPYEKRFIVRCRLKVKGEKGFAFVDIYSRKRNAEAMNLLCHQGNILYVEAEFECARASTHKERFQFVIANSIRCLRRAEDTKVCDENIVKLLDATDPVAFIRGRRKK